MQPKKRNAKMTVKKGMKHARASPKQNFSPKKKIEKKTENDKKPKDNKTMLIAQEVKFARLLANNDKKVRDKVLKNLKKWLTMRSKSSFGFTEADFRRLWKGLFYCMWMSDKPLVQEDLAESLSKLLHCFNSTDTALLYTKCTFKSLADEWFGIDRYRIDKFEMLVRKILRQTFVMCKKQSWNKQLVIGLGKVIEEVLLDPKTCLGLKLHITEVYMEELAKISEGSTPKNIVTEFIRPFVIHLAGMSDLREMKHVVKNVFKYLIFQSDVGMDYTEKFNAWREAGFPCKNIDEMHKIEVSDEEDEHDDEMEVNDSTIKASESKEKPLDPRAGRVDVEIPQLPFDPAEIVAVLKENRFHKSSTTKSRKHMTCLINDFSKLIEGEMPFGIKEIPIPETSRINPYDAAEELLKLDEELYSDSSKNNRKRKKNGNLTEFDENSDNIEELIPPIEENNASLVISSKNKKQKVTDESDLSDKVNDKLENTKAIKQNSKVKLLVQKKAAKRLNVSEPLPNKKLKKASKKLNNAISKCSEESITVSADNAGTTNTSSTAGTCCNWNVEVAAPITLEPSANIKTNSVKNLDKKSVKKNKILADKIDSNLLKTNIPWLTPVLTRLEEQNKTPPPAKLTLDQTPKTDSAKKRVKIMLQRNTAQNTSEYIRQLKQSPAIPFDANRKPKAGVLKPSPLSSPMNPFYNRKIF